MAEDIAKSGIRAGIEAGTNCIEGEETESAGAGYPGQRWRYRVQSWDELGQHEKRNPIPGEDLFRPAIVGIRVSREAVNKMQDLVTSLPTRLVPQPVSQNTGSDSQTERGDHAQLPGGCERPGRKQKQRSR